MTTFRLRGIDVRIPLALSLGILGLWYASRGPVPQRLPSGVESVTREVSWISAADYSSRPLIFELAGTVRIIPFEDISDSPTFRTLSPQCVSHYDVDPHVSLWGIDLDKALTPIIEEARMAGFNGLEFITTDHYVFTASIDDQLTLSASLDHVDDRVDTPYNVAVLDDHELLYVVEQVAKVRATTSKADRTFRTSLDLPIPPVRSLRDILQERWGHDVHLADLVSDQAQSVFVMSEADSFSAYIGGEFIRSTNLSFDPASDSYTVKSVTAPFLKNRSLVRDVGYIGQLD